MKSNFLYRISGGGGTVSNTANNVNVNVNLKLDGTNANTVPNSNSSGLESKNETVCKPNDNSNTNKQQATSVVIDNTKDTHDGHNAPVSND